MSDQTISGLKRLKMWRPNENWKAPQHYSIKGLIDDGPQDIAYEAGADDMFKAVRDKVAELSNRYMDDDKMFRMKLLLWLTSEEE